MATDNNNPWPGLVVAARAGDGQLWLELQPLLVRIARRVAPQIGDDAVQVAVIAIWKSLVSVDLDRPSEVRAYLLRVGVNAMHDEIRKYLRRTKGVVELVQDVARRDEFEHGSDFDGDVLRLYLRYIETTGTFKGSHKHVAGILGVSTSRASNMFHEAAKSYRKETGRGTHQSRRYEDTVQRILQG